MKNLQLIAERIVLSETEISEYMSALKKTKKLRIIYILILIMILDINYSYSQGVAINENNLPSDNSAILDLSSTEQGLLIPRLTEDQRNDISYGTHGYNAGYSLLIYNTTSNCFEFWAHGRWNKLGCVAEPDGPYCGSQIWLEGNLNVGDMISSGSGGYLQGGAANGIKKYCLNNIEANCDIYGGLYEWTQAMMITTNWNQDVDHGYLGYNCDPCSPTSTPPAVQGICPDGYHIPSDLEFSRYEWCVETTIAPYGTTDLNTFQYTNSYRGAIGNEGAGMKMKVDSTSAPYWNGTNASGFSVVPAYWRWGHNGMFLDPNLTTFWTGTEHNIYSAIGHFLSTFNDNTAIGTATKKSGVSVRCLKD
jgi:uncharacterized protein (TIGR02145 family)